MTFSMNVGSVSIICLVFRNCTPTHPLDQHRPNRCQLFCVLLQKTQKKRVRRQRSCQTGSMDTCLVLSCFEGPTTKESVELENSDVSVNLEQSALSYAVDGVVNYVRIVNDLSCPSDPTPTRTCVLTCGKEVQQMNGYIIKRAHTYKHVPY